MRHESPRSSRSSVGATIGSGVVKRTPPEDIAAFLSFSGTSCDHLDAMKRLDARQWQAVMQWLDDAGLALYFLQKLKDLNATDSVPPFVVSGLEIDLASNRLRAEEMSRRFGVLNKAFDDAGVRYAVVKGFSLIPEFCPDATLRHQSDFDYLIELDALAVASQIVVQAGYTPKQSRSSKESIFVLPGGEPSRGAAKYLPLAPHAVELHTDMWDSALHGVPPIPSLFSTERAIPKCWSGLTFPALADEDAFLLQVIHACHHLFTLWIRMSNLFEIAYFLNRRAFDEDLWSRIEQRVGDSVILQEFVVIVTELAARLFAAPVPPPVQVWGASLRPAARVWIEHYARRWAFCELPVYQFSLFPRSKLALFLRQEYEKSAASQESEQNPARSVSRVGRMSTSIRNDPSLALNIAWWKRQLLIRRSIFHALSGARYAYELPRWWWLTRTRARSVS